jgi:hypothetical protein
LRDRHLPAHPDLASLLGAYGLSGALEAPFSHSGFSGATLTRLVRDDGVSFILKRTSISRDWIMRATADAECRERFIDDSALPLGIRSPLLGAAIDDEGAYALLMRDISGDLLPPGVVAADRLDFMLQRISELHAAPTPARVPWCAPESRLTLLTSSTAQVAASYGASVAADIMEGWRLFERHAPKRAVTLIYEISRHPAPLLRALSELPSVFMHGDLKFDNVGLDAGRRMWLIDWALTLVAPAAVELGWFLAINSRRMSLALDDVMALYATHANIDAAHRERHDALTVVCGLLLRGWRKALDAESGEPDELKWWCERALDAERFLS